MKSVLISIKPKWCELIASGEKTVEVRKSKPKLDTPFKVYIYCTKQKVNGEILLTYDKKVEGRNRGFRDKGDIALAGKVIGKFVCDKVFDICIEISKPDDLPGCPFPCTGLTDKEILQYLGNGRTGYGWHISDLVIYDKPRELGEFSSGSSRLEFSNTKDGFPWKWSGMKRPPQSWCYVEQKDGADNEMD